MKSSQLSATFSGPYGTPINRRPRVISLSIVPNRFSADWARLQRLQIAEGVGSRLVCAERQKVRFRNMVAKHFLGTVNPTAERMYRRLGWQSISGANAIVLLMYHASPTECFDDYFQHTRDQNGETPIAIRVIVTRERMATIPLPMHPHSEFLLEANLNLYSTRYTTQKSCMGLFGNIPVAPATIAGCAPLLTIAPVELLDWPPPSSMKRVARKSMVLPIRISMEHGTSSIKPAYLGANHIAAAEPRSRGATQTNSQSLKN